MIGLSVEPGDRETQYYNKPASELQSGVEVHDTWITGTLKKTVGYSLFDGDNADHHLVLKLESSDAEKIETKMVGGATVMKDYVTVDDGFCVYSVTEKNKQKVFVKVTKGDKSTEYIYSLSGLTLADKVEE